MNPTLLLFATTRLLGIQSYAQPTAITWQLQGAYFGCRGKCKLGNAILSIIRNSPRPDAVLEWYRMGHGYCRAKRANP